MTKDKSQKGGFMDWVERVGNKIPHPFILFLYLIIILSIISLIVSKAGIEVVNPSDGEMVSANNIISTEGAEFLLLNAVKNFTGFAPLGLVLTMTLGIGLAEEVGMMSTFMRKTILGAHPKLITFMIMFIGINGNIASDAASIIIPSIAGMIFYSIGRNPVVGIALGYAATSAGFTANLLVAGTDGLLAGITNEASAMMGWEEIPVTGNWYFMIASTFLLSIVGTLMTEKFIEPRVGPLKGQKDISQDEVTPEESKALRASGIGLLIFVLVIAIAAFPQDSFLRNPETGSLINGSPLFKGIIPILFLMFVVTAVPYGVSIGKIKESGDVPLYMTKAMAKMAPFIVSAFIMGQFIALFNWSNLGIILAVSGAALLEASGFVGIPLFIIFIFVCAFINLFIGSGSAKWAMLAPIFVPMFGLLGYSPGFTQVIYRIGDSATNIISPLQSVLPVLIGYMNQYDEEAGLGTLFSMTIPYSMSFLLAWIVLLTAWYILDLPLGPGVGIYM